MLAGDRLLNNDATWSQVVSVKAEDKPLTAYNLTVSDFHTYFVSGSNASNSDAASVWVHNVCYDAHFPSRSAALRGAKERAGIPRSQQPKEVYTKDLEDLNTGKSQLDSNNQPIKTRNYVYDHPKHGRVVIQEHSVGHAAYPDQPAGQPHFNVEKYHGVDKEGKHIKSSISGVSGHYTFD